MSLQSKIACLPENLRPPETCYSCTTPLQLDGAFPFCPNYHCPERVYGRLQKFANVLDIKGLGKETLRLLVRTLGISKVADLWDVSEKDFITLDRKGVKHYAKFREGLQSAQKLSTSQIFAALDIDGTGTFEAICRVDGLQTPAQILAEAQKLGGSDASMYYRMSGGLFANAERVSEDGALTIAREILARKDEIEAFLKRVEVKELGAKLIGKVFVITGTLSQSRSLIEAAIKAEGGSCGSDVSAKTSYLVTNNPDPSSGKGVKAKKLGVPIITESQLMEMLGNG